MLWLKAFHVMAVIAWMAGMFYLPRLFVYHAEAQAGSETSETFKVMERRLYRIIMQPAIGVVWVTGLGLAYLGNYWLDGWFLASLRWLS
jgi:putative membrane protein